MIELEKPPFQPQVSPSNASSNKQKLPNAGIILGLGIASIATCCCYGALGLISIILASVALVMAKKELELYNASPDLYSNYDHLKIGGILAFIGLGFGVLHLLYCIVMLVFYGGMVMVESLGFF